MNRFRGTEHATISYCETSGAFRFLSFYLSQPLIMWSQSTSMLWAPQGIDTFLMLRGFKRGRKVAACVLIRAVSILSSIIFTYSDTLIASPYTDGLMDEWPPSISPTHRYISIPRTLPYPPCLNANARSNTSPTSNLQW